MTERKESSRSVCRPPLAARAWCAYFKANADSLLHIPWHQGVNLTDIERADVGSSLQEFQFGESGEGRHFLHAAKQYAEKTGEVEDYEYVAALRLFIAEEQRHGADLGRILDGADIPRIRRLWCNRFFRWLRHLAGLELIISVLLTAEVIAKVYYAALRKATGSAVLRRLCEQILRDEAMHIRFQSERLARIRGRYPRWRVQAAQRLQRIFFKGTCLVVWRSHGRAVRAGGLTFASYWRRAQREFNAALRLMDPRHYQFEESTDAPLRDSLSARLTSKVGTTALTRV